MRICPGSQDGHWLAELYQPPKKYFFRGQKMKTSRDAHPLLKKSQIQKKNFSFGCFCRKFCHTDLDFREQQAILLKEVENLRPKLRFVRRKFWHDSVTPFSTVANITGSLPTTSTTPDRLRQTVKAVFGQLSFRRSQKKSGFSKGSPSSPDLYPKRSPS